MFLENVCSSIGMDYHNLFPPKFLKNSKFSVAFAQNLILNVINVQSRRGQIPLSSGLDKG